METYFTLKLWMEFYIPLIIIGALILLLLLFWVICKIEGSFETHMKNKHHK